MRTPLLLLAVVALGCTPDDTKSADSGASTGTTGTTDTAGATPQGAPDEPGPYSIGTSVHSITTATGQALRVQVWYPAPADATEALHSYDGLLTEDALDAPSAACDGASPVLLFSHGNGGLRYQSVFLTEHLASRGWVVVAPDHEGNTTFDIDTDRWGELALRRPVDISQSFDWLVAELAGAGGALEGCVDPDAGYAVAGHSFGGYTAAALTSAVVTRSHAESCATSGWLCAQVVAELDARAETSADLRDARVWASVPMTPAAYELLSDTLSQASAPALVWGGDRDDTTPVDSQVRPIYADTGAADKHFAVIEDAGHYTFSDACSLLPTYPDCGGDYIDIPEAHRLVRGTTTAFFEELAGLDVDTTGWLPPTDPAVLYESAR